MQNWNSRLLLLRGQVLSNDLSPKACKRSLEIQGEMKTEFELIELLKKKIPRRLQGPAGIGDDAAVMPPLGGRQWLFTTDVLVEGVDFIRSKIAPEMAGRKAVAANLSDIAAMGGEPFAFVAAIGIPKGMSEAWIERFYSGMVKMAARHKTLFAGGDTSRAKEFFVSVAMTGISHAAPVSRSGARAGDFIGVTGDLGGSILKHHYFFKPRIREGRFLSEKIRVTAMIDISDGLLQDLGHILKASGTGAELALDRIPVSQDAKRLAGHHPAKALRHALTDGEDFELLFTAPSSAKRKLELAWPKKFPGVKLSWIGRITAQKQKIGWMKDGKKIPGPVFKKAGFSHF